MTLLAAKTTDEAWSSKQVTEMVSSKKYVALKVVKDSLEYKQFSQLYAVFLVPSIFCIGRTGQNLMVMNGGQSASQLREKLADAFQKYDSEAQPPPPGAAKPPIATAPPQPQPAVTTAQPISTVSPTGSEVQSRASGTSSKQEESKEETLKRYQEKIAERRRERMKDEFEKEKHHEIQRREHGKDVAKYKQEREEQQNQNWLKERQRQKEEARLAREAVKAKLEQDKLERQAWKRNASAGNQPRAEEASPPVSSVFSSVATSGLCRIQLKLPAGSTRVIELNKTDTLEALRECVAKEINENLDDVLLTSSYPRRELSHDMDSNTMLQLQLVPSGVVIVRVKKSTYALSPGSSTGGGIMGALMSLLQILVYCLNLLKNTVVGLFSGGRSQESKPDQSSPQPTSWKSDRAGNEIGGGGGNSRDGLRVRKFRQEDYHDDSDEDGTYNGNSTQQQ